jgi:hypothetical protein
VDHKWFLTKSEKKNLLPGGDIKVMTVKGITGSHRVPVSWQESFGEAIHLGY